MTDLPIRPPSFLQKLDKVWLTTLGLALAVLLLDRMNAQAILGDAVGSLLHTGPFIVFAVLAIGALKATGAETLVAKAFEGREMRMIFVAAFAGGLSPFCSCEVIPFIAALLAAGAPLSGVMAFWLASPLMDPAMYAITAGALGVSFATAKLISAVAIATVGGLLTMVLTRTVLKGDVLRVAPQKSCGCGSGLNNGKPVWKFWQDPARIETFRTAATNNAVFLIKWLALAYMVSAVMKQYVPAEIIGGLVGGDGLGPVMLAALVGAPAYLNGYAAPALVETFMSQGMSPGAGMAFLIAGGVTCVPAAIAVWALVKPKVFVLYFILGFLGAVSAGLVWNVIA